MALEARAVTLDRDGFSAFQQLNGKMYVSLLSFGRVRHADLFIACATFGYSTRQRFPVHKALSSSEMPGVRLEMVVGWFRGDDDDIVLNIYHVLSLRRQYFVQRIGFAHSH